MEKMNKKKKKKKKQYISRDVLRFAPECRPDLNQSPTQPYKIETSCIQDQTTRHAIARVGSRPERKYKKGGLEKRRKKSC
jgi:hypothetical protein